MTIVLTVSSFEAASNRDTNSQIISCDNALRLVGRLKASTLTPSVGVDAVTNESVMVTRSGENP